MDSKREEFEKWAIEHKYAYRNDQGFWAFGGYNTAQMWLSWQAALASLQPAQEPFGYFHELLDHEGKGQGIWLGCANRKVVEDSYDEGEVGKEIVTLYASPLPQAALSSVDAQKVRDEALEEAAKWHETQAAGWDKAADGHKANYEETNGAKNEKAAEVHLRRWESASTMAAMHGEFADAIRALQSQSLPSSTEKGAEDALKAKVQAFETAIKDFVSGYEVDTGEGIYQPNEHERFLIDMALRDALHNDDFAPAFAAIAQKENG